MSYLRQRESDQAPLHVRFENRGISFYLFRGECVELLNRQYLRLAALTSAVR